MTKRIYPYTLTRRSAAEFLDYLARRSEAHGEKFDSSELAASFRPFFHGPRVRVSTTWGDGEVQTATGTVSATTGWRPSLMLMHRSSDHGSSQLLTEGRDVITHVQIGRTYVPVADLVNLPGVRTSA